MALYFLTLYDDRRRGLDTSLAIAGVTLIEPLVRGGEVPNVQTSRACDGKAPVIGNRFPVFRGPCNFWLRVPRDAALQGDASIYERLRGLWMDYKHRLG